MRQPEPVLLQLLRFGAVGAVGVVVNLLVFNGLMLIPGVELPGKSLYAVAAATLVAIGVNWVGNRYWAFSASRSEDAAREGIQFLVVSLAGMLIPVGCVWFSQTVLGLHGLVADNVAGNAVGLALGTLFRFVLYRVWVFAPRARSGEETRRAATLVG
ncbi:GtrA family protein [Leifsonia sp. 22587]|uniref:GtrA family protein n=1 Tax=Leifsonia sp. 22587 TaxID=3453946 RepID=UPI003F83D0F8